MEVLLALMIIGISALLANSMRKDRSRYRNCMLLMVDMFFVLIFVFIMIAKLRIGYFVNLGILFILFLSVILVPIFLVWNGVLMIRREGRSIANLLSLFLGIVIGLGEILFFRIVLGMDLQGSWTWKNDVTLIFIITVIYGSFSFLSFMFYTLFLEIIPHRRDFDYVIIHGAGLINGDKVSRLLGNRIDKAIEIYHKDPTPPKLIPSGGKGSDETISEAEAMKKYLLEHGIPEKDILLEDKSTTTLENLQFSKQLIEQDNKGNYIALVSSNYHVYRCMRLARKISMKCVGIGAHVAWYYWPSALIREYVAVHSELKHLIILFLGWLLFVSPFLFGM